MQLHRLHSSLRGHFAIMLMAALVLGATGLMAATTYYDNIACVRTSTRWGLGGQP